MFIRRHLGYGPSLSSLLEANRSSEILLQTGRTGFVSGLPAVYASKTEELIYASKELLGDNSKDKWTISNCERVVELPLCRTALSILKVVSTISGDTSCERCGKNTKVGEYHIICEGTIL